jgi:hypothetical protein
MLGCKVARRKSRTLESCWAVLESGSSTLVMVRPLPVPPWTSKLDVPCCN